MPVAILIHSGAPNDAKLLDEILKKLQKKRIIKQNDIIIFDKGYYSYRNYQIAINKYKIIPLIFPRENFDIKKIKRQISYPLEIFSKKKPTDHLKNIFKNLYKKLIKLLENWKSYKPIRGKIEDFFKLCKTGLHLKQIHKYTPKSAKKKQSY